MKKKSMYLFATLFVASALIFSSCSDEKDYYSPDINIETPLEGIIAPDDFDWKTTNTVNAMVAVDDAFNGAHNYVIEIFDENPVTAKDAMLLTRGFARKGMPLVTKITLPTTLKRVFIRQTTPTGLASIRMASTEANINCDFASASTKSTRSVVGAAKLSVDFTPPNHDDTSIFPTEAPAYAEDVQIVNDKGFLQGGTPAAYKAYKITKALENADLSVEDYVELYITEDLSLNYAFFGRENIKIFILPGKTVTDLGSIGKNSMLSIGKNATLEGFGGLFLSDAECYNLGTIQEHNVANFNGAFVFYNAGEVEIMDAGGNSFHLWPANDGATGLIYNTGIINTQGVFKNEGGANIYNSATGIMHMTREISLVYNADHDLKFINDNEITCAGFMSTDCMEVENNGLMTVRNETSMSTIISNRSALLANNGVWITGMSSFYQYGLTNRCKFITKTSMSITESNVINDAEAYINVGEMFCVYDSRVEMASEALLHVEGETYMSSYQGIDNEFVGTGTKRALMVTPEIAFDTNRTFAAHYKGNLQIACNSHPNDIDEHGRTIWTLTDGADFSSIENNTVHIPATECNEGWGTPPPDPTDPNPEDVVDPFDYTFLFEDQWPLYGDYDMNDVVIRISKITQTADKNNKVSKLSFTYQLEAVGATSPAGAALMLDGIPASHIESVTYSDKTPTQFNTESSGVESGQTTTVIPLFANAHSFLGRDGGTFINTQKGSSNNVSNVPSITVTVTFVTPIDLGTEVSSFNLFITDVNVGGNSRKEIHQRGYQPSNRANSIYFGSGNDASKSGIYYVSEDNLVWSFVIPSNFKWPVEYKNIQEAYTGFAGWVQSGGVENQNWWETPTNGNVYE